MLPEQAVTEGMLWAMGRSTFRTIVLAARMESRQCYEKALADMEIFQSLSPANRSSIADCLTAEVYEVCALLWSALPCPALFGKLYLPRKGAH
jgi:hypothetical protein